MQRFLKWLGILLFKKERETELRQTGIRSKPKARMRQERNKGRRAADHQQSGVMDFDPQIRGRVEDGGPGKNVFVRNKYLDEDSATNKRLRVIGGSSENDGDADGVDPYNTGSFDRANNWKSRTRS